MKSAFACYVLLRQLKKNSSVLEIVRPRLSFTRVKKRHSLIEKDILSSYIAKFSNIWKVTIIKFSFLYLKQVGPYFEEERLLQAAYILKLMYRVI